MLVSCMVKKPLTALFKVIQQPVVKVLIIYWVFLLTSVSHYRAMKMVLFSGNSLPISYNLNICIFVICSCFVISLLY